MYKRTGRQSDNPCINEWCGECEPIMSDCKLLFKHNNFYLLFSPLYSKGEKILSFVWFILKQMGISVPSLASVKQVTQYCNTPVKVGCVVAINNYTVHRLN